MRITGWVAGALLVATGLVGCSGSLDVRCGLLGICPRPTTHPAPVTSAAPSVGTVIGMTGRLDASDGSSVRVEASLGADTADRLDSGTTTVTNDGPAWHRHAAGEYFLWVAVPARAGCLAPTQASRSGELCWSPVADVLPARGPQGLQPGQPATLNLTVQELRRPPQDAARFALLVPSSSFDVAGVTLLHQCPSFEPDRNSGPKPSGDASAQPFEHTAGVVLAASDGPVTCTDLP